MKIDAEAEHKLILSAAQAIPDPVFVLDQQGRYVAVFGGREKSLYSSATHLVGKRIDDVFSKKMANLFQAVVDEAFEVTVTMWGRVERSTAR